MRSAIVPLFNNKKSRDCRIYPAEIMSDSNAIPDSKCLGESKISSTPTTQSTTCSSNIPLPLTHVSRTESEVQLALDIAAAERRDERMFHRLIHGMHTRHQRRIAAAAATYKIESEAFRHAEQIPESSTNCHDNLLLYSNDTTDHDTGCVHLVNAVARIVDTHHSNIDVPTDFTAETNHHPHRTNYSYDDNTGSTQLFLNYPVPNHSSGSALSDNDWSITGYNTGNGSSSQFFPPQQSTSIENPNEVVFDDDEDDDNESEDIFILDL